MFWALLSAHFNLRLSARAKMSLSGPKPVYAREHKLYCFVVVVAVVCELRVCP